MSEAVELHAPDPGWADAFARERALVLQCFPVAPRLVEHIGSTAVPGLAAKPIIDIIVLVDDLYAARVAIPALEATGYVYRADDPQDPKLFLAKGLPPAPRRTHHLHIHDDGNEVQRHLLFRDHLRAHPAARDAYLDLKQYLATRYRDDREAYARLKTAFIDDLLHALGGPARRVSGNP